MRIPRGIVDVLLDPLVGGPEAQPGQVDFMQVNLTALFHFLQQSNLSLRRHRMLGTFEFRIGGNNLHSFGNAHLLKILIRNLPDFCLIDQVVDPGAQIPADSGVAVFGDQSVIL